MRVSERILCSNHMDSKHTSLIFPHYARTFLRNHILAKFRGVRIFDISETIWPTPLNEAFEYCKKEPGWLRKATTRPNNEECRCHTLEPAYIGGREPQEDRLTSY